MKRKTIYRILFINQLQNVYEVYARGIAQHDLIGFVVIEDLVFDETTSVVVDPAQEKLKAEFNGVKRFFVPMHAIIRIDQVEKEGVSKIMPIRDNITAFPRPAMYDKPPRDTQ